MKYFTEAILEMLDHESEVEYAEGARRWRQNDSEYQSIFEKIKLRLPEAFLKAYSENEYFHDYEIIKMALSYIDDNLFEPLTLTLYLKYRKSSWSICFCRVKKVEINSCKDEDDGQLDYWRYSEILPVDDETLSFEILLSSGAKILVHFADADVSASRVAN